MLSGIFFRILWFYDGYIVFCVIYIFSCVLGYFICFIKGVVKFYVLVMLNVNEYLDVGILNCENMGNDSGMKFFGKDIMMK